MKDETAGFLTEKFVGLQTKKYLYLVDDNREYKKERDVNQNVVSTISHNEYDVVLLNKNYFRDAMNRIQSRDHRTESYVTKKIHCLVLTTKHFFKTIDIMDQLLDIKVNQKKQLF